ncbi:hypothetical protein [Pelagovum sp. HNIBRBA483]|uniref:hypothetical protein n=1 Tax=Pelagovum sp. HNIBRBA483 TaxID=3233341 RepID=UPI0034A30BFE
MNPTYTFMSRSTAKPGRFDDLIRITKAPPAAIDKAADGVIAWQVAADREQNSVVIWVTLDRKETMDAYLSSPEGQAEHGDAGEMEQIIETFEMFNLTPQAGRLPA